MVNVYFLSLYVCSYCCSTLILSYSIVLQNKKIELALILGFILGDALFTLKNSLKASPSQLHDWNRDQVNPCTWLNVICDPNSHVTSVYANVDQNL